MHHRKAIRFVSNTCAAIAATLVFSTPLLAADPKIDLYVGEVNGQQKLLFGSTGCPNGKPGEICVAKGSKVWIMWELDKASNDAGWELSGLRLSWDDPLLTPCIVDDFNVDPQSGVALDFEVKPGGKEARNRDENDCTKAYEANYTISATHPTMGPINSDPVIRNGGRN